MKQKQFAYSDYCTKYLSFFNTRIQWFHEKSWGIYIQMLQCSSVEIASVQSFSQLILNLRGLPYDVFDRTRFFDYGGFPKHALTQ